MKKNYDFSEGVRGPVKEAVKILKKDKTTQNLHRYLFEQITNLESFKRSFILEIRKDPAKALDNCDRAFEYMAKLRVFNQVKEALEGKDSKANFDSIFTYAGDQTANGAGRTGQSTSTTGTFFERCETAAWANLYREMVTMFKRGQ